jgi:hypothetical protein
MEYFLAIDFSGATNRFGYRPSWGRSIPESHGALDQASYVLNFCSNAGKVHYSIFELDIESGNVE